MNAMLTPDKSIVNQGLLLNLVVRKGDGIEAKPFVVSKDFNISDYLVQIRSEGVYKSEDVLLKLSQMLEGDGIIHPVKSYVLDLGQSGRPSEALEDHYRFAINSSSWVAKMMLDSIENLYLSFLGDGDQSVHVLSVEQGPALAHAKVILDLFDGGHYHTELDIVGPEGATFAADLNDRIAEDLTEALKEKYPEALFEITVMIRPSDLHTAQAVLNGSPINQPPLEHWTYGHRRH